MGGLSQILSVKYLSLVIFPRHLMLQSLGITRVGLEQTISLTVFFVKNVFSDYISRSGNILSLQHMKLAVGSRTPVLPLKYGKCGGILSKIWIAILW